MRDLVLAGYAGIFATMLALHLWGVAKHRTVALGDLVGMLVRYPAVRWPLIVAWLWWGWHVLVRVTL